jgi:hypothetical protein
MRTNHEPCKIRDWSLKLLRLLIFWLLSQHLSLFSIYKLSMNRALYLSFTTMQIYEGQSSILCSQDASLLCSRPLLSRP